MSKKYGNCGTKLEEYLKGNGIDSKTDNDLVAVLDKIITTERDHDLVKEAIELYFEIRGYSIDDPFGEFDRERKRLLEDLK